MELFACADFAREHDSKSTSGATMSLLGPNSYSYCKKQTVCQRSHCLSNTLFKQAPGAAARLAALPKQECISPIVNSDLKGRDKNESRTLSWFKAIVHIHYTASLLVPLAGADPAPQLQWLVSRTPRP